MGPQIPVIFLFHGALFAMTLAISVFQTQFSPEQQPVYSTKRSASKLDGAGEYVKAEYREDARKDIGSLVMQEHGHPVSDLQDTCGDQTCFPAEDKNLQG